MSVLLYVVHCFSTCYVDMARQYKSMQTQLEMRIQFLEAEVKRLTAQLGECGWVARPLNIHTYVHALWHNVDVRMSVASTGLFLYSSGCVAHDCRR